MRYREPDVQMLFRAVNALQPGVPPAARPAGRANRGVDGQDVHDGPLLASAAAGDRDALAALYRRHGAAVYRYAWLVTGSESAAADVVQDSFLALLGRADGFDPTRGSLPAYLCGIARHLALRETDHRCDSIDDVDSLAEQQGNALPAGDLPSAAAERAQALSRLYAAIRQLPPPYRDVLVLVELQEMSYADAALVAGIELGTVRSRLSRARARLAQLMRDQQPDRGEAR